MSYSHDYYLCIDSGDLVAGVPPKGSPMDIFIGVVPEKGNTVGVPKGGVEWAVNIGKKRYHEILIELKNTEYDPRARSPRLAGGTVGPVVLVVGASWGGSSRLGPVLPMPRTTCAGLRE